MKRPQVRRIHFILGLWFVAAVLIATKRSFWCDELIRLNESKLALGAGLHGLFSEPSPFAPGEAVLNWLSRILFSAFLPAEIWGRLPGIMWGLLTIKTMNDVADRRKMPWLVVLSIFSVSMTTLSILMRPYGSLIFAGALALDRLDQENARPSRFWLVAFTAAFCHLYGICYLALSSFLLKRWKETAAMGLWILCVLFLAQIHSGQGGNAQAHAADILRSSLGTLFNPHKVAPLAALLALWGAFLLYQNRPKAFRNINALLAASLAGPIAATAASHYFFVPRQIVGAQACAWYLCAIGIGALKKTPLRSWLWPVTFLISVVPWTLSIPLRMPPYPDQPLHLFKTEVQQAKKGMVPYTLFTDYWNVKPIVYYLQETWGTLPGAKNVVSADGTSLQRYCYPGPVCFDFPVGPEPQDTPKDTSAYSRIYYTNLPPYPLPPNTAKKWTRDW